MSRGTALRSTQMYWVYYLITIRVVVSVSNVSVSRWTWGVCLNISVSPQYHYSNVSIAFRDSDVLGAVSVLASYVFTTPPCMNTHHWPHQRQWRRQITAYVFTLFFCKVHLTLGMAYSTIYNRLCSDGRYPMAVVKFSLWSSRHQNKTVIDCA